MDDLVEKLRGLAACAETPPGCCVALNDPLLFNAADEIGRLRCIEAAAKGILEARKAHQRRWVGRAHSGFTPDIRELERALGSVSAPVSNCVRCGGRGGVLEHGTEYPSGQKWGDCPDCGGTGALTKRDH